jgi:Tfp pilus assembly PilM family ATPase
MSVLETLTKIIPPPTYMQLPAVGVDVSDTSLKYIEFVPDSRSGTALTLTQWGDIEIPEGALSRGVVNDGTALTRALLTMK